MINAALKDTESEPRNCEIEGYVKHAQKEHMLPESPQICFSPNLGRTISKEESKRNLNPSVIEVLVAQGFYCYKNWKLNQKHQHISQRPLESH